MKKIAALLAMLVVFACQTEEKPKDYVLISGKIHHTSPERELILSKGKQDKHVIKISDDGTFRDTLKLEDPAYYMMHYYDMSYLYLRNGMELEIDIKDSLSTPVFDGKGKEENRVLNRHNKLRDEVSGVYPFYGLFNLTEPEFNGKMDHYLEDFNDLIGSYKELDTAFVNHQKKRAVSFRESMFPMYEKYQKMLEELGKGKPSPEFNDYINYKGGTTSLKDLRGKFVYIDVWATWCTPCKAEIPFLKEVEEVYHDKNIAFVSISIDRKEDEQQWRDMIADKNMGGIQLWAGKNRDIDFVDRYYIEGIPRFILLDPQGNIVTHDAPRPSSPELRTLLDRVL